ncbi:hypothetical protein [Lapillicoccus jejuensis]|uniref:Uncharacterized protein n=1 Tax=Lapillicoccus jejuensis TaxID=402171 RepID=A0A542DV50_9MICO|nr:hypothetical protein [Lapillicoccus jejuensis]TQJ06977.1 hypothetical protein FB458_0022 [Lapillicoccus jejuensis]
MRTTPHARRRSTAAVAAAALLGLTVTGVAAAKGGEPGDDTGGGTTAAAAGGNYAVTVNGTTYDPAPGKDAKVSGVRMTGPVTVKGVHTTFTLDPRTLGVYDYTLTGAPSPERLVTAPTVVFASKVPSLSAAQLAAPVLDLQVRDDTLVALVRTSGGKLKVQAKDAPQGGIFQMEPEFGTAVTITHQLGPTLFYFVNPFTGKVNFGNGIDAVTSAQSATGAHQMLLGKDSPQVATRTQQTGSVTTWSVASGGRLGGVLGEDAIELSQGATNCVKDCQAQNRINGSLPVPPDPTNPTPIGG